MNKTKGGALARHHAISSYVSLAKTALSITSQLKSGAASRGVRRRTAPRPLLRFATIEPRTTPKGVTYLGETKLTIRWRHMSRHVEWQEPLPSAHSSSGQGNGGCDPPILACDHT